jgi:hypothetical protein
MRQCFGSSLATLYYWKPYESHKNGSGEYTVLIHFLYSLVQHTFTFVCNRMILFPRTNFKESCETHKILVRCRSEEESFVICTHNTCETRKYIYFLFRVNQRHPLLRLHIYIYHFIMYSGITKICYRKTVGHVFTKPVQIEGTIEIFFFPVRCFSS